MSDEHQPSFANPFASAKKENLLNLNANELIALNQKLQKSNRILKFKNNSLALLMSLGNFAHTENINSAQLLHHFLEEICKFCHWPLAHIYFINDEDDTEPQEAILIPSTIWFEGEPVKFKNFIDKTMQTHFRKGEGLPGKVLETLEPQWIENVFNSGSFLRQDEGKKLSMIGGFAVPIFSDNKLCAVAEFFTDNIKYKKKKYLKIMIRAAATISTLLERRSAEKKLLKKNQELKSAWDELKQIQIQLFQTSKMASIGQLAAGVAHEINNPIGYLANNLRVLTKYMVIIKEIMQMRQQFYDNISQELSPEISRKKQELNKNEKAKKIDFIIDDIDNLLSESAEGVQRVSDIVIGLKSFARINEAEFKEASINECMESTLKVIWNEIKYKCEVIKDFGEIPPLKCNPGQLNQVFMNLLVNASQAIEYKGTITIKTYVEDGKVCISISDTGCGIPQSNRESIFEPFFTTKPVGIGTGLGLSISYGIIQKHGGTIEVDSHVGEGTTFLIRIPQENSIAQSSVSA